MRASRRMTAYTVSRCISVWSVKCPIAESNNKRLTHKTTTPPEPIMSRFLAHFLRNHKPKPNATRVAAMNGNTMGAIIEEGRFWPATIYVSTLTSVRVLKLRLGNSRMQVATTMTIAARANSSSAITVMAKGRLFARTSRLAPRAESELNLDSSSGCISTDSSYRGVLISKIRSLAVFSSQSLEHRSSSPLRPADTQLPAVSSTAIEPGREATQ
jgi:hypothetical protein